MTKETTKKQDCIISFGRGHVVYLPATGWSDSTDENGVVWRNIKESWTVLNWGTNQGLGQLAHNGPTSTTVFNANPAGNIIPNHAIHGIWIVKDPSLFEKIMSESRDKIVNGE
jgi:hypothetical protein